MDRKTCHNNTTLDILRIARGNNDVCVWWRVQGTNKVYCLPRDKNIIITKNIIYNMKAERTKCRLTAVYTYSIII